MIHGTRYTDCSTLQRFLHISSFHLSQHSCLFFFLSYLSHTQLGFSLYPYTQPCSLIPIFLTTLEIFTQTFLISLLNKLFLRYTEIVFSYVESTEAFVGSYTWEVIVLAVVYTQHQTSLLLDIRNGGGWRRSRSRWKNQLYYTLNSRTIRCFRLQLSC